MSYDPEYVAQVIVDTIGDDDETVIEWAKAIRAIGAERDEARAEVKRLREAGEETIRLLELVPGTRPAPALLEARIELRAALNAGSSKEA